MELMTQEISFILYIENEALSLLRPMIWTGIFIINLCEAIPILGMILNGSSD